MAPRPGLLARLSPTGVVERTRIAPTHMGMKMVQGPRFFRTFSGSWHFKELGDGRLEVVYRYRYRYDRRSPWLQPISHRIANWYLGRDIERRVEAFVTGCEDDEPHALPAQGPARAGVSDALKLLAQHISRNTTRYGLQLVGGQLLHPGHEARAAPHPGGDLGELRPVLPGAHDGALDSAQGWFIGRNRRPLGPRQSAEVEHALDVSRAAPEAPGNLRTRHAPVSEPQHHALQRAKSFSIHGWLS